MPSSAQRERLNVLGLAALLALAGLGLVLFLAGGLPRWERWLVTDMGRWSPARDRIWWTALLVLWLIQMPRSLPYWYDPRQHAQLRRVDEVDARCRVRRKP